MAICWRDGHVSLTFWGGNGHHAGGGAGGMATTPCPLSVLFFFVLSVLSLSLLSPVVVEVESGLCCAVEACTILK